MHNETIPFFLLECFRAGESANEMRHHSQISSPLVSNTLIVFKEPDLDFHRRHLFESRDPWIPDQHILPFSSFMKNVYVWDDAAR